MRLREPPTIARTRWMFGFQRREVRRCECEMLLPKLGFLPQTSQLAATGYLLRPGNGWSAGLFPLPTRRARAHRASGLR